MPQLEDCNCPGPTVTDTTCPVHANPDVLPMWVVYDHPADFPNTYVARQHIIGISGQEATDRTMEADTLESIRAAMVNLGLTCITRSPEDDPVIVEVWL